MSQLTARLGRRASSFCLRAARFLLSRLEGPPLGGGRASCGRADRGPDGAKIWTNIIIITVRRVPLAWAARGGGRQMARARARALARRLSGRKLAGGGPRGEPLCSWEWRPTELSGAKLSLPIWRRDKLGGQGSAPPDLGRANAKPNRPHHLGRAHPAPRVRAEWRRRRRRRPISAGPCLRPWAWGARLVCETWSFGRNLFARQRKPAASVAAIGPLAAPKLRARLHGGPSELPLALNAGHRRPRGGLERGEI